MRILPEPEFDTVRVAVQGEGLIQPKVRCTGCRGEFPFRILEVDQIVPQSKGGSDYIDNLQALCSFCNRVKGDREQAYLLARLKSDGMIQ